MWLQAVTIGGNIKCKADNSYRHQVEFHMASHKLSVEIIEAHALRNGWRSLNKTKKEKRKREYTSAHAIDNTLSLARLNSVYCFEHHMIYFTKSFIAPVGISDHSMIQCQSWRRGRPRPLWHQDVYVRHGLPEARTSALMELCLPATGHY